MTGQTTIVIPIYERVTHLDFTGPHMFFSRVPNFKVVVASVGAQPVSVEGMAFSQLTDLNSISDCDVLCVPGGGIANAIENASYMDAIRRIASRARYITSVCNGSLILGAAGLLKGKRAACHWAYRHMLDSVGAIPDPARVARDGNIITGGGITAGIDFAITVVAEVAGEKAARTVQLALEYAPAPPFDSGRPETASPDVVQAVRARYEPNFPGIRAAVARALNAS